MRKTEESKCFPKEDKKQIGALQDSTLIDLSFYKLSVKILHTQQ